MTALLVPNNKMSYHQGVGNCLFNAYQPAFKFSLAWVPFALFSYQKMLIIFAPKPCISYAK
jgi:hypothetical protein